MNSNRAICQKKNLSINDKNKKINNIDKNTTDYCQIISIIKKQ